MSWLSCVWWWSCSIVLFWLSCLAILSWPYCPSYPVFAACPGCLILTFLSCYPFLAVCPGCLSCMSKLSFPGKPFLTVVSWQSSPACVSWQFVLAVVVLDILFCEHCHKTAKNVYSRIKKKIATWQFPLEILCGMSTAVRVIIAVVIPLEALYYRKPGQLKNLIFYI